ncbi:hypothetical protein H6P81_006812 [Aristolochia fimbriata]|uniref:Signal peptidase complex subunit 2 n=1 Tax=Aristolochia fimbriata TaxID=158543 RepID=A0AAV7EYL7_ARIFI|nr:hypothetical protein H6P81_006812 [Aristolochia fimbriata]
MAAINSGSTKSNPKKANLLDPHFIKHILDESVTEIVTARRYNEDYVALHALWYLITYKKEKNAILITYPIEGSFSTGLVISSKLPRFSDMYTLTVASADPKSIAANKPVHLTKSVTKWFTRDGVLVESLFWQDVNKLIDEYRVNMAKNGMLIQRERLVDEVEIHFIYIVLRGAVLE